MKLRLMGGKWGGCVGFVLKVGEPRGVWGECGVFGVKLRGLGGQLEGKQR